MNAAPSSDPLARLVQAGIRAGVLPPTADVPDGDGRPWPVVLLTALGAWLAALPLLGVVALLLGDWISRGVGPYVVGTLVLAAACVVLRSRSLPLFVEQLAVPALLVGGGSLAFGLARDLPDEATTATMALLSLAVGAAVPRPWLRVLLGALAAVLAALAFGPHRWYDFGFGDRLPFWWAWHAVLLLAAGAVALQGRVASARPTAAAAVEALATGALLAILAGLAWWSGMTFLLAGSFDVGIAGELANATGQAGWPRWHTTAPQAGSVLLATTGVAWGVHRWPACREPWFAGLAAVLIVLSWFMPALGGSLLVLSWAATTRRGRLACAAAVAAAWIVGSFYYQLHWPLATKAAVLAAAGAALGLLVWLRHRTRREAPAPGVAAPRTRALPWGLAAAAVCTVAVANVAIWQKEQLIAQGRPVYVRLAPVDPRSLMQGDYMALEFAIPWEVRDTLRESSSARRPRVVARIDEQGIATVMRLDDGSALAADELRIELTPRRGSWVLVSDAWFFKEGEAARWEQAQYGEFRVLPDGRALLVNMRGAKLQPL